MRYNSWFPARSGRMVLAALLAVVGWGASQQVLAATAEGDIEALVVRPIEIEADTPLRFGAFSTSAAGQTLAIGTDGSQTPGGADGGPKLVTSVGEVSAATFTVSGEGGLTYSITLPDSAEIATGEAAANEKMEVSDFVSDPPVNTGGQLSGSLGSLGTQTLKVGAKLTTVANQAPGEYAGTFDVTVEYQ